jgi:hypothetical protein
LERYIEGYQLRTVDNGLGGSVTKLVWTVLDAVFDPKGKGKPGNRANKQPPTLNQGPVFTTASWATKILPRKCRTSAKAEAKQAKEKGPCFDEDGCIRIKIADPVVGRKNKHTVNPLRFGEASGPDVGKTRNLGKGAKLGGRRASTMPTICDNSKYVLVGIKMDKVPGTKFYQATCKCRNAEAKLCKTLIIKRVRNKVQALARLTAEHGITK